VRNVAAIPAAGLLAGAALGLVLPDLPHAPGYACLIACAALAVWAWRTARGRLLATAAFVAFADGGALLSADAWQRAWRPPLRVVFDELARRERAEAALEGRRLPEDDEAFAIVEGTLRADASPTEGGVSLSIAVDGVIRQDGPKRREGQDGRDGRGAMEREGFSRATRRATTSPSPTSGGIVVTIVGSLAAGHVDDWRAAAPRSSER